MCASFVSVQPAGVQVAQQDALVIWLPLVFVRFAHDEVLDECERVVLFTGKPSKIKLRLN